MAGGGPRRRFRRPTQQGPVVGEVDVPIEGQRPEVDEVASGVGPELGPGEARQGEAEGQGRGEAPPGGPPEEGAEARHGGAEPEGQGQAGVEDPKGRKAHSPCQQGTRETGEPGHGDIIEGDAMARLAY